MISHHTSMFEHKDRRLKTWSAQQSERSQSTLWNVAVADPSSAQTANDVSSGFEIQVRASSRRGFRGAVTSGNGPFPKVGSVKHSSALVRLADLRTEMSAFQACDLGDILRADVGGCEACRSW